MADSGNRTYGESRHNEFSHSTINGNVNIGRENETSESKYLQSLYTSAYAAHKNRNPERVVGTLEWFLDDAKYRRWQEMKSGVLLVTADPGCGKSVLASFLVDDLHGQSERSATTVCYFFFKDDSDEQKTATFALSALLHQLFATKTSLLRHAANDYKNKGPKYAHEFDTLCRIFKAATADPQCGDVICVIDALDECEVLTRKKFIDLLVGTHRGHTAAGGTSPKFLVTSRPDGSIADRFGKLRTIRLDAEGQPSNGIIADIKRVIRFKIDELGEAPWLSIVGKECLLSILIEGADRTFLWVSLILVILNDAAPSNLNDFSDIINAPDGLDTLYDKILQRSQDPRKARTILEIVIAATQPLTLDEMNIALAIESGDKSIEDLKPRLFFSPETKLKDICGHFVKVIDRKIYLIHQTAKEFMMRSAGNSQAAMGGSPWMHTFCPIQSDLTLAKSCIYYLLFTVFETRPLDSSREVNVYVQQHVFLGYAATNWAAHAAKANVWQSPEYSALTLGVYNSGSRRLLTWFRVYLEAIRPFSPAVGSMTSLSVASYVGDNTAVRLLIDNGADVNLPTGMDDNALNVAARRKDGIIAKLLLDAGAKVYLLGDEYVDLPKTKRRDFRAWWEAAEREWEAAAEAAERAAEREWERRWWRREARREAWARWARWLEWRRWRREWEREISPFLEQFCLDDD